MPQVALSDLEARVWGRLDNDQAFYQKATVDRSINEAARIVNLFGGFSQGRVTIGLTVEGWMWYRVPTSIVFPMKVYLDGKELRKQPVTGACSMYPKWMRGIANRAVAMWVPIGTRMFAIVPPDGVGGKVIEVWGVTTPPLLVNADDSLTLDDEYVNLIENYCLMNLTLREGGKVFADASKEYNAWMARMRDLQRWESKINPKYWVEVDKGSS